MIRSVVLGLALTLTCATTALAQQVIGGCSILPADNIWNTPIDSLPVLSNSAAMVTTIGASRGFHADFGSGTWDGGPIGIPFITVSGAQAKYPASFMYADESDAGPYPIPFNVPIEGGANSTGDRHAIAIDTDNCVVYELYRAFPGSASWTADSGAIFDLKSHALRPSTWTSADAAGLPIMPGLVTYEEVLSGEIKHAIRFTAPQTRREFVWPARHFASSLTGTQYPRMGERFRLKASFDVSGFPADVQVILRAMKKYGIILADNGSGWYLTGKPDPRWNNDNLRALHQLLGSNFEAVDATVLRIDANSGQARQSGVTVAVSPATASVRIGEAATFTATVGGATGGVRWSVNDIAGGDAVVGTIDSNGRYVPPSAVPTPNQVTVRASSIATPSASGAAVVTIAAAATTPTPPPPPPPAPPAVSAVNPASLTTGSFTMTVDGTGFTAGTVVLFDGTPLTTTVISSVRLTATGNAPTAKASVPLQAKTADGRTSNVISVAVTAPASTVRIDVSPKSTTVRVNDSKRFTASITGTANTGKVWKVNGIVGGNSTLGTISTSGLYRAPRIVPSPATVTVTVTSAADPTKAASASVTVRRR